MAETITYAGSATATGGPSIGFTVAMSVGGYGKGSAIVAKNGGTTKVALNTPGANVALFLIKSSKYDAKVTVKAGGSAVPLNAPLVVGGTGVASALIGAATDIEFTNGLAEDIAVEVFVARNA
jgi:hypothetical protein